MGLEVKGWTGELVVTTQEQRKREGGGLALILCLATLTSVHLSGPHPLLFPNLDPPSFSLGTPDTNL